MSHQAKLMGAGLVIALALTIATTVTPASAEPGAQGAVVIHDGGCGVINGDGGFTSATISNAVITKGPGKLTCRVSGAPNSTGTAQIFNFENTGLLCGAPSGVTQRWRNVVSASGEVTLTCWTR